jgi:hypothetical protein
MPKLIISDEPAEIIIQKGLNINKFKKKIPHLLIRYVLSFLSTKQQRPFTYYSECSKWWNYDIKYIAFQLTYRSKYIPIIVRNFEIANWKDIQNVLKRKNYGIYFNYKSKAKFIESVKYNERFYDKKNALCLFIISGIISRPKPKCLNIDCKRSAFSKDIDSKHWGCRGTDECSCCYPYHWNCCETCVEIINK